MFRLETLLEIIVADMRERADFSADDELDLVVCCFDLSLRSPKKVKEKWILYKTMNNDCGFCTAVLKSGPSKGKICAKKSTDGSSLCKTHLASVQRERLRQELPQPQQLEVETQPQRRECMPSPPPQEEQKKIHTVTNDDLVIKPNRFRNFVYPGTSLILDPKDKRITAREGIEGEWLPLMTEDIRACKAMKLRYKVVDLEFQGEM